MSSIGDIFDYDDEFFGWTRHFYTLLDLIHDHQNSYCFETSRRVLKKNLNREILKT